MRTIYGDSQTSFEPSDNLPPFQRIGQGNGNSGTVWAAIITILLNILHNEGYGAHFISSIIKEVTDILGFAFIDDTELIHIDINPSTTIIEFSETMQTAIDLREH